MLSRAGGAVLAHTVGLARVRTHATREPAKWRRRRRHALVPSPERVLHVIKDARRPKPGAADDEGEGKLEEHAQKQLEPRRVRGVAANVLKVHVGTLCAAQLEHRLARPTGHLVAGRGLEQLLAPLSALVAHHNVLVRWRRWAPPEPGVRVRVAGCGKRALLLHRHHAQHTVCRRCTHHQMSGTEWREDRVRVVRWRAGGGRTAHREQRECKRGQEERLPLGPHRVVVLEDGRDREQREHSRLERRLQKPVEARAHMVIGAPEGEHVAQEEGIAHLSSRN